MITLLATYCVACVIGWVIFCYTAVPPVMRWSLLVGLTFFAPIIMPVVIVFMLISRFFNR